MAEPIADSIELAGAGLRLRPYRSADAMRWWRPRTNRSRRSAAGCRGATRATPKPTPECAEAWRSGEHYAFAIFDEATSGFCGGAGLNLRNRPHNFMNLGYWIRAARQRQGIVRSAARLVAAFGFEQVGLTRIEIITAPDNRASRRAAEAVGARFEGISRNRIVERGKAADAAVYALIPDDLRPARAGQEAAQMSSMSS